jgi:hypothetical protein
MNSLFVRPVRPTFLEQRLLACFLHLMATPLPYGAIAQSISLSSQLAEMRD